MSDRLFFGLSAGAAALMIVAALMWPQGLGTRSPPPFGHPVIKHAPGGLQVPGSPASMKKKGGITVQSPL